MSASAPGVGDRAQELADAVVGVAQLEDLLDDRAVLALQLARLHGRRVLVGALLDLGAQAAQRVGVGGADDAAVQPGEGDGARAAGQADAVGDLGDGADRGVLVLVPRHQQHAVLVADVHRQGDGHAREHDGVVERDEQQFGQDGSLHSCSRYRNCTDRERDPADGAHSRPSSERRREDDPRRPDERLERHARRRLRERLLGQERHVDEAAARLGSLALEQRLQAVEDVVAEEATGVARRRGGNVSARSAATISSTGSVER